MSRRAAKRARKKLERRQGEFDRLRLEQRKGRKRPGSTSRKSRT